MPVTNQPESVIGKSGSKPIKYLRVIQKLPTTMFFSNEQETRQNVPITKSMQKITDKT